MAGKTILDLSTLEPDRLAITIDGIRYELNAREDFGIRQLVRLEKLYKSIQTKADLPEAEFGDEQAEEFAREMDACLRLLMRDCPDEVHAVLTDQQRWAVFLAFKEAAGAALETPQPPQNRRERRSTTARPSQRSSGSMAATRSAG